MQTASSALASIAQLVLRQRFLKDEFDSTDIESTVRECCSLFHTTEGDRLAATLELMRRYATIGGDAEASSSVRCPHCGWGFAPTVINQHIREKH